MGLETHEQGSQMPPWGPIRTISVERTEGAQWREAMGLGTGSVVFEAASQE